MVADPIDPRGDMTPTATATRPDTVDTGRPVGRSEVMEAVLDAATELFAERGPDAVTVREVADRAGVNHALIHRHFGTKEELLRIVLAKAIERMAAVARDTTNTGEDIRDVIAAMRREEPAIRLLAWALLAGYPIEQIWPEYPAFQKVQSVLAEDRDVAGDRAVLLDDPGGQPIRRSSALTEVAIDGPDHSARIEGDELRVRWRSADGVLHGEHEPCTRFQRAMHRTKEPVEVREVVHCQ